jgi:hypothetical protein
VAIVPCTPAIRALLAFSFDHDPAHNFLLKRGCCRFAQAVGITSDPRITFPYLLKICASKLGLWAPAGSRTATASLDIPPSSSAPASRSYPRRARRTVVAHLSRFRPLAVFERLPSARVDRVVVQASENLHKNDVGFFCPLPRPSGHRRAGTRRDVPLAEINASYIRG